MASKYIAIEGMDGSGKTTQAKMLTEFLKKQGFSVLSVTEPSKSALGKMISEKLIKKKYSPEAVALAFSCDRMIHFDEIIRPASEKYDYIITDRSYISSMAYQPLQGLRFEWVRELNRYVMKPDLIFLLDIPAVVFMQRRGKTKVIFENHEFQKKLRQAYLALPKRLNEDFIVVDGIKGIDEIHEKIRSDVMRLP
ncbi:MAG: dTMP kinase [Candidatus Aenigmarchaeota archaeon]|nr:dTMP kinase [Candidatus Aenigmarchaeota archaeon]